MAEDWPPPLASRAVRRHCEHQAKGGYCVHCGTQVAPPASADSETGAQQ